MCQREAWTNDPYPTPWSLWELTGRIPEGPKGTSQPGERPRLLTTRWLGAWARDGSRGGGCLCSCRSPSNCSSSSVFMESPCLARPAHSGGGELGAGGTGTEATACCCCCSSFSSSSCCRT